MQQGSTVVTVKLSSNHHNGNSFLAICNKIRMMLIILFTYNAAVHHK